MKYLLRIAEADFKIVLDDLSEYKAAVSNALNELERKIAILEKAYHFVPPEMPKDCVIQQIAMKENDVTYAYLTQVKQSGPQPDDKSKTMPITRNIV